MEEMKNHEKVNNKKENPRRRLYRRAGAGGGKALPPVPLRGVHEELRLSAAL